MTIIKVTVRKALVPQLPVSCCSSCRVILISNHFPLLSPPQVQNLERISWVCYVSNSFYHSTSIELQETVHINPLISRETFSNPLFMVPNQAFLFPHTYNSILPSLALEKSPSCHPVETPLSNFSSPSQPFAKFLATAQNWHPFPLTPAHKRQHSNLKVKSPNWITSLSRLPWAIMTFCAPSLWAAWIDRPMAEPN